MTGERLQQLRRAAAYELLQRSATSEDSQLIRTSLICWHQQVVLANQQRRLETAKAELESQSKATNFSQCNDLPTVKVAKDRLQQRLLLASLSGQESACLRAVWAAWWEYVHNRRRLEFQDAQLAESRRTSILVDAACARWQKWENALLLWALLHHWRSSSTGLTQDSRSNLVPEPSPRSALYLRSFRASTLQQFVSSPHSPCGTPRSPKCRTPRCSPGVAMQRK